MTEHIVALFASASAADAASRDLANAGIPETAIRRYSADKSPSFASSENTSSTGGFWAWLLGEEDGIDAQRARYPNDQDAWDRNVQGDNCALSVTCSDQSLAERAATILENHHPLHIDESAHGTAEMADMTSSTANAAPAYGAARPASSQSEDVIPLREEDVKIGTRSVDRGVTRVRRYIVETPVEREVTLHGERVTIERRRPMEGRALSDGGLEERTVEVRETEEVPTIEKTARVVEEVAIRKEATERTETIRDVARREEVEVIDDKGAKRNNP